MQFYHPQWFHGFWLIGILILFLFWVEQRKRKRLKLFGDWDTVQVLTQTHSPAKNRTKSILLVVATSLLILTLAQPQWGETKKEIQRKGLDIIFLIDTSLSMLAEDTPPNRISKAKLEMKGFLSELKGDRVGIVTFAGSGFIQSPLTLDYDAFLLFANSIQVGYIPDPGTSLSEAIRIAIKAFPKKKSKNQVILILSDGEHHEGDVESAIKLAGESQIRIYTVGIGTKEGSPIPLRSSQEGKVSGYKKDRAGEVVITKLNDEILTRIAKDTGGLYFPATPSGRELDYISQHMQNLEKQEFKQRIVIERENHFQLFLLPAFIFLIVEMLIHEVKKEKKLYV